MTGRGSYDDPKRPMFTAAVVSGAAQGMLSFSYQVSDDGKYAIVQLVSKDRTALKPILGDSVNSVLVFEKGKDSRESIEIELRKYKKDFDFSKFVGMGVGGGK